MKITREQLIEKGYEEKRDENGNSFYVKGCLALVRNFNVWLPCHYEQGSILGNRLYVENMEELELIGG